MGFGNCNFKEVLILRIKAARQDKSPLLVQVLNIPKSVSVLHILPTLFWRCIDIFPDGTYLDAHLICFLHSQSSVDLLGNEKVFLSLFPSIGQSSAINNVIQARLNPIVEIIKGFALLDASLNIMTKLFTKGALPTIVWQVGVHWCRFGNIPFLWLVSGSGGNCCSSVVAWSSL